MLEKAPPWLNARQDIVEEQMEDLRRALLRHLAVFKASLHEAEALAVPGPTPSSGAGPALCGQKAWLDTGAPAAVAAMRPQLMAWPSPACLFGRPMGRSSLRACAAGWCGCPVFATRWASLPREEARM